MVSGMKLRLLTRSLLDDVNSSKTTHIHFFARPPLSTEKIKSIKEILLFKHQFSIYDRFTHFSPILAIIKQIQA